MTRVIFRLRLVRCPVVGDALDYYFGIVAAGEGALGVCPIVARIGSCGRWVWCAWLLVFGLNAETFGQVFFNREIAERVDRIASCRAWTINSRKFAVGESRKRSTRVESVAAGSPPN